MDVIDKVCKALFDNSIKFVDLCLEGNSDFNNLSDDLKVLVRNICISLLFTWEIAKLSESLNKTDFFGK